MGVELNIDLGELPNEPVELYALAHRVNIACGGHAGDENSMRRACQQAAATGAKIGAHPSYPDREGFGRKRPSISPDALRGSLEAQCTALRLAAQHPKAAIVHVKPHGALYHDANREPSLAQLVIDAAVATLGTVAIVGPPTGALREAALAAGCPFLAEGFADRGYASDGTLISRDRPGALLTDPLAATEQALRLRDSGRYQTLCVHSDTPDAVAIARAVRAVLDAP